jgi:hypothetical protein
MYPEKVKLVFGQLEYEIVEYSYYYSDATPPVFITSATVKVPKNIFPHALDIGLPIETALIFVEKNNAGMAKYIKKVLEGYSDKPEGELEAFRSLDNDGFDMKAYYYNMLSEISLQIEKTG